MKQREKLRWERKNGKVSVGKDLGMGKTELKKTIAEISKRWKKWGGNF